MSSAATSTGASAGTGAGAAQPSASAGPPRLAAEDRHGWIDATAGASGDMLLGAALDAGASLDNVNQALAALALPERLWVEARTVTRGAIRANRALVHAPDTVHSRPWSVIREILSSAALRPSVKTRAIATFELLADAEAWVHGTTPAEVIFHEVGGLDALADIVGVCAAVDQLGLDRLYCSPVAVGSGTVATAHGSLPVPTPATARLLMLAGATMMGSNLSHEACTPTGAALLAGLVDHFRPPDRLRVTHYGTGAGRRDPAGRPNVTRLMVGAARPIGPEDPRADDASRPVVAPAFEITANVDDCEPQVWPYVIDRCLRAGADDAWIVPIWMKKGRAAVSIHVLCEEALVGAMGAVLVSETSTIGYRIRQVHKRALARRIVTVQVAEHAIRVKLAFDGDHRVNTAAEYEDAAIAARESGQPLREVIRMAVELAVERHSVFENTPGGASCQ